MPKGSIVFHFEKTEKLALSKKKYTEWLQKVIISEGRGLGTINCIFCTDEYLLNMNQTYLNHDTLTDIVTFNYVEQDIISGDLFISVDRVKENAETFEVSFLGELKRVMVHGVLHLIGYNDKTPEEAKEIRAKEDFYLTLFAD
jgi:rRNA maturation RNase YbeY